ncbi:hypothetical protein BKA81DRAFT_127459 [Phyllosticta paracitricarpa]
MRCRSSLSRPLLLLLQHARRTLSSSDASSGSRISPTDHFHRAHSSASQIIVSFPQQPKKQAARHELAVISFCLLRAMLAPQSVAPPNCSINLHPGSRCSLARYAALGAATPMYFVARLKFN